VFHQGGVDFDGHDARRPAQQFLRERAATGSDFDRQVFAGGADGGGNALQNAGVCQEVLPELLRQGWPLATQVVSAAKDHLFQTPSGLAADRGRCKLRKHDETLHFIRQFAPGEIVILHAPAVVN